VESLTGSDVVADRFVFAAGSSLSGSLNGGSGVGVDEINVSALTGSVNLATKKITGAGGIWSGYESFVSTGGTLTGADVTTSWLISGDRTGTVGYQEASISFALSFAGFSILQGGSQADVFTFGTLGRVTTVFGGAGADRLVGPDLAVSWILTEAGCGSLLNSVSFKQFENLQGGAVADRFQVRPAGSLTGSIDAGAGENVLDYTLFSTAINVDLTSGMLKGTNVGGLVDSFALVMGGSGADTIKGSTTRSMILVGNGGSDALWGGGSNDILVGGLGADTLRGQGGQDILIGGRVLYDTTVDGLIRIWREWSRSDTDYGGRINHLMGTTPNGLNGTYYLRNKLSATDPLPGTLPDDSTIDTLFGGGDTDWFISATADLDSDIVSGETKTAPAKLTW
jgi:Ca2+-binding RTX toxin-like protein